MPKRVWQALPCSSGTANVSAHNTICGLTRLEGCIVSVCRDLDAPSCRCAGYDRVRSSVLRLTCAPYPICSACSPGPHRAGVPGRSFPVVPDSVGWERAASRGPAYPRSEKVVGVRLRSHLGHAFQSGTGSLSRPIIMYVGRLRRMLPLRRLLG